MKILYAGYRPWARHAYRDIVPRHDEHQMHIVYSQEEMMMALNLTDYDVIFLVGWSWIIPAELCERHYIVGLHPSDLPAYAGGTPLQHQIIDGVIESKCTLFRITPKIDAGGIICKSNLSLHGNMSDVFTSLAQSTVNLFENFIDLWHNHNGPPPETTQDLSEKPRKRLKPDDSKLTQEIFMSLSARQLYDFIRCREDPYPNVFIKDESGTLKFKLVDFEDPDEGTA